MNRCWLSTSLQLRAPLCRPPWIYSRLPHHGRSFVFAARLAKDHEVEASAEPKRDEQKEGEKSSRKKKEEKIKDTEKEGKEGGSKKKAEEERKDGSKDKKKVEGEKEAKDGEVAEVHEKIDANGGKEDSKPVFRKHIAVAKARRSQLRRASLTKGNKRLQLRKKTGEIQQEDKPAQGDVSKDLLSAAAGQSLKEALVGAQDGARKKRKANVTKDDFEKLDIKHINADELDFQPIHVEIPPVPKLAYGLDRVLFNPGVYRLQDPRSRVYNFDPYLEKIMSVREFNFAALSEYKTSSKDEELLALTERMETKFTGSTSSMSGVLQHFHFLLSNFRKLNHEMLSQKFPSPTDRFSKITEGPSAIFLRWKDGIYAIDADKGYDTPNIMSWLGHSLEKLLTVDREEFERYRRSTGDAAPGEDESSRCYHYSKLGNFLMRSQLDAHDPRLPGTGVFDLKTRAVVSIRMNHEEYESGTGYQIRYDQGEWESYEREFYDMTRATMLKYSLQVRMGRMDGIFVAYHNIERIFGFQYLPVEDMDNVLHGQKDPSLGDQEFRLSIRLLDELIQKATEKYPEQTLRLHFHTHRSKSRNPPFMYIFAEPVTEEQADAIQNKNQEAHRAFERDIIGIAKDDPALQAEWHEIQDRVDEEVNSDHEVEAKEAEKAKKAEVTDQESSAQLNEESSQEDLETSDTPEAPKGPLMGWTLAVRHRLNGSYVERPEKLDSNDSWTLEYHIRELNEGDRWSLYEKVKKKRDELIGEARNKGSVKASLQKYRQVIQKYSDKGRVWREEQDALAAEAEPKVYEPLGPGSHIQTRDTE